MSPLLPPSRFLSILKSLACLTLFACLTSLACLATLAFLAPLTAPAAPATPAPAAPPAPRSFQAVDYARKTLYHSPQTPGYTCWVGAWIMPDNALMVTFDQATGPLRDRPRTDPALLKKMGIALAPDRDFTGLDLANVFLRSTDGGATWHKIAQYDFTGPFDRPVFAGSYCAASDGAILRAVDGSQLPLAPDLPRRIFFQRSRDLGATWGDPEIPPEPHRNADDLLGDAGDCITRVRRLRDGRLAATGVIRPQADPVRRPSGEPLLMFSTDDGRTWAPQKIGLPPSAVDPGAWNEWDSAQLPSGDFLCVFRRKDPAQPRKQVRWQGLLHQTGPDAWILKDYHPAVFEHSGHPELLAVREGIILHIATTGIHFTGDGGATWRPLEFKGLNKPWRSCYYPRSFQTGDGGIFVFSHKGSDNAYGACDQAIIMDSFRLSP